ncbi:hypothetical protein RU86_GL000639 [Lactococcus piscium]|uniref:HTH araC/xylS-type domain-containing protein n=1 Tax=Pseudolactococcus piscium TaxID=1364 RepID=A0A2A5RWN0_9LACT|nr:AraC family transcriptional regulator [Lactococcus piscium]PCS05632.1 hypothetical protein RU86_GL000639 [Lactococcus piscium]
MEKSIFYIAPETQYFNIGIQYRFSGFSQTMSLHNYGPTVRTHYIFHIILDGKGTFSVDDQQFHLSKGDIFLVRPDMIHRYISDANAPWSYCWLAIKGPVVADFLEKTPFANNVHVIQSHHFSTYIDIIQNTLQIRDANPSSELKLTSLCLDFFNKLMTDDFISSKEKVLTYQKLPVNTMTYLLNNYTDDIKVSDISDHMFVNRSHLSRVFKSYYNTTIQNALQQIRINAAANLLYTTHQSILDISIAVGFNSQIVFNRAFKKLTGLNPSQFRNQQHQVNHEAADQELTDILQNLSVLGETPFST